MKNITIWIIIITISIFIPIDLFCQSEDSLDFKDYVRKNIADSTSIFFYPKLQAKVKNHPSKITTADCFIYIMDRFSKRIIHLYHSTQKTKEKNFIWHWEMVIVKKL